MRISDWSSDVCSSDLTPAVQRHRRDEVGAHQEFPPGPRQPSPECRRRMGMVGMLVSEDQRSAGQIGRASCRERVCLYVLISVVAVPLKQKLTLSLYTS